MHGEITAAVIKQRVDLLALIGQDTRLKRVAGTAGGEYAGPCPFCGGRDRLRVQPARRRWWCRRCGQDTRWEDAIDYVRKRDRVDFVEACRRLGAPDDEPGRTLIAARRPARACRTNGQCRDSRPADSTEACPIVPDACGIARERRGLDRRARGRRGAHSSLASRSTAVPRGR